MDKYPQKNKKPGIDKDYLVIIFIAVAGTFVLFALFVRLYIVTKQSTINMWNSEVLTLSQEIEYYLSFPKDAVIFSSQGVEAMIEEGATNEDIKNYLVNETDVYSEIIESNATGIYGYIRGEYVDGSGWLPPGDYVATSRPWYIDAVKADGDIAYVEPYFNVQTGMVMMSVSKLLSDKESVISMDFYLDSIQEKDADLVKYKELEAVLVLDADGLVVAHSDENQIGKNYAREINDEYVDIFKGVSSAHNNIFSVGKGRNKKFVFSKRINNDWYTVFVFDEGRLFGAIGIIYAHSIFVLTIVFFSFWAAIHLYKKKNRERSQLEGELAAIADIYLSLSILDLKELKLNKMWVSEKLTQILSAKQYSLERVDEIAEGIAVESSRAMLAEFMNFPTLGERLKDNKSISHDFLDIDNHWTRMYFIAGERDEEGNVTRVIWATESIDEDRRRQEALRKKAETDSLTKILNRNGGEIRLYEAFEAGRKGMLLIVDADHFKKVNDTYGHDVGDKVIIAMADCLTETFRDSDIVFRLGGDEFMVFASGVDTVDIGLIVADRLFMNSEQIHVPEAPDWKMEISVGATFCKPNDGQSFADYYKQADSAMYESKQKSGNYITFYKR